VPTDVLLLEFGLCVGGLYFRIGW